MTTMGWNTWRCTGLALGATALLATYGCGGSNATGVSAASTPVAGGMPVVIGCEAHQRTLVRQAIVNGTAVSQVECVTAAPPAEQVQAVATPYAQAPAFYPPAAQPAAYVPRPVQTLPAPAAQPAAAPVRPPVYDDLGDARVVPTSSAPARPVRTNQVIYEERRAPARRSTAKSAVIIGSSAGAGAGVGAAVGGKKGALIGAAIGGGGAAIWDQVTRRK